MSHAPNVIKVGDCMLTRSHIMAFRLSTSEHRIAARMQTLIFLTGRESPLAIDGDHVDTLTRLL